MKFFVLAALLLSAPSFAAAPPAMKVFTAFDVKQIPFTLDGVLVLSKEARSKLEYSGRANIHGRGITSSEFSREVTLTIKKKAHGALADFGFWDGEEKVDFYIELPALVAPTEGRFEGRLVMGHWAHNIDAWPQQYWSEDVNERIEFTVSYPDRESVRE